MLHLAPKDVLIAIEVSLIDDLNTDAIESIIENIESKVKQAIPYNIFKDMWNLNEQSNLGRSIDSRNNINLRLNIMQ